MARKKAITTDELIHLADQYRIANPGMKIKIPEFGNFVRSNGHSNVQDYTIRRDPKVCEHIHTLNAQAAAIRETDLVTYHTLDIDAFIRKNLTPAKLKAALTQLDQYYCRIAEHAVTAITERKNLEKKLKILKRKMLSKRLPFSHLNPNIKMNVIKRKMSSSVH